MYTEQKSTSVYIKEIFKYDEIPSSGCIELGIVTKGITVIFMLGQA